MSTLEDLDDLEQQDRDDKKDADDKKKQDANGDATMQDADAEKKENEEDAIDAEILNSGTREIITRRRLLENDSRIMRSEFQRLSHEKEAMHAKIKDNVEKIDNNR